MNHPPSTARSPLALAGTVLLTLLVALGPVAPALDPQARFFVDWHNSLWMIGRHAQAIQAGALPSLFHTDALIGMPTPAFYGPLFYPALGLVATVTGAPAALALALGGLAIGMTLLLTGLFRRLGAGSYRALGYTALATWTVYPMTCLYNRSAIPEYFAQGLLICALVALGHSLRARTQPEGRRWLHCAGWLLAAIGGTHLLTACYGGLALALAGLGWNGAAFPRWTKGARHAAALPFLLAAAVFSPTAYLLTALGSRLAITAGLDGRAFLIPGLDGLANRLWPIPWVPAEAAVSTPGMDVQINTPLLAFVVCGLLFTFGIRPRLPRARRAALGLTALALGLLLVSSHGAPAWLQAPFWPVQFAYRLVAYTNFFLLAALLALVVAHRRQPRRLDLLLAAMLAWSVVGVALKHYRCFHHLRPERIDQTAAARLLRLPPTFYGGLDYALEPAAIRRSQSAKALPQATIEFLPTAASPAGQISPIEFVAPNPALIRTNVLHFPWNQIWRNGHRVLPEEIDAIDYRLAVRVTAGAHRLEYRSAPDAIWLWLRRGATALVALWAIGLLVAWVRSPRPRVIAA